MSLYSYTCASIDIDIDTVIISMRMSSLTDVGPCKRRRRFSITCPKNEYLLVGYHSRLSGTAEVHVDGRMRDEDVHHYREVVASKTIQ